MFTHAQILPKKGSFKALKIIVLLYKCKDSLLKLLKDLKKSTHKTYLNNKAIELDNCDCKHGLQFKNGACFAHV